jgi:hypothetical protein
MGQSQLMRLSETLVSGSRALGYREFWLPIAVRLEHPDEIRPFRSFAERLPRIERLGMKRGWMPGQSSSEKAGAW